MFFGVCAGKLVVFETIYTGILIVYDISDNYCLRHRAMQARHGPGVHYCLVNKKGYHYRLSFFSSFQTHANCLCIY